MKFIGWKKVTQTGQVNNIKTGDWHTTFPREPLAQRRRRREAAEKMSRANKIWTRLNTFSNLRQTTEADVKAVRWVVRRAEEGGDEESCVWSSAPFVRPDCLLHVAWFAAQNGLIAAAHCSQEHERDEDNGWRGKLAAVCGNEIRSYPTEDLSEDEWQHGEGHFDQKLRIWPPAGGVSPFRYWQPSLRARYINTPLNEQATLRMCVRFCHVNLWNLFHEANRCFFSALSTSDDPRRPTRRRHRSPVPSPVRPETKQPLNASHLQWNLEAF